MESASLKIRLDESPDCDTAPDPVLSMCLNEMTSRDSLQPELSYDAMV